MLKTVVINLKTMIDHDVCSVSVIERRSESSIMQSNHFAYYSWLRNEAAALRGRVYYDSKSRIKIRLIVIDDQTGLDVDVYSKKGLVNPSHPLFPLSRSSSWLEVLEKHTALAGVIS